MLKQGSQTCGSRCLVFNDFDDLKDLGQKVLTQKITIVWGKMSVL